MEDHSIALSNSSLGSQRSRISTWNQLKGVLNHDFEIRTVNPPSLFCWYFEFYKPSRSVFFFFQVMKNRMRQVIDTIKMQFILKLEWEFNLSLTY